MSAPSVVEDVFLAALDKSTPEERAAFLKAACKDDADLRRRVERLLEAHPKAGSFLASPARPNGEETAAHGPTGEQVGALIAGRYKLLELIGEGGMGEVWVAEQTQPVRRKVALKLIKAGMDSKSVLSRFEAERQALALMDHPNIAKVLDGGTAENGRPFFVMEYVKGVPITEYCDATRLSIPQRLNLFVQVCEAVQHAHQKGIIHRDLKPSNILVAPYDDKPVPKVIDFGLAKAMHQSLTERTLHTAHETVLGTPLYMSPEQAQLNNLDVDTRSDIYSLGVLLYELLTGTTPLEKQRFKEAAWDEVRRLIREEEPPLPSTRLSSTATLPSLAAGRQTEPTRLTKLVRGELDWIVMKALEKDRARRYDTATGMAKDIQRYLADEVVEARPPSATYRLRKFARKHRLALGTTAAFAGLLIAAAGISALLAMKARRAEGAAENKRMEAEANAKEAKQYADAWSKTLNEHMNVALDAEIRSVALKVDLDLAELRTDRRFGLLGLARPLKHTFGPLHIFETNSDGTMEGNFEKNPRFVELREFVTAAVLATGQDYAPLLPPITHDGQPVVFTSLSPDNQTLLTLGKDYTPRLWDARTARSIAILRKDDERVVNCGFSPDGRTVFTDDQSSVARLWEAPSGRFRTAIEARQNRNVASGSWLSSEEARNASQIGEGRLLTRRIVGEETQKSPVELWDTATGGLVARLDAPDRDVQSFQLLNGGRWITTLEQVENRFSNLLVFSAEDGRLLGRLNHRLNHPAGESLDPVRVDVSPTGRSIATASDISVTPDGLVQKSDERLFIRVWDAQTWQVQTLTTIPGSWGSYFGASFVKPPVRIRYWMDDAYGGREAVVALGHDGGWTVYRAGQNEPIAEFSVTSIWPDRFARVGDLAHCGNGWVYDTRTWQRLLPPPGRKFHPDLARFAADGRFVPAAINSERVLVDTRTDKAFATSSEWHFLPEFGMVATADDRTTIRLIPLASRLDLPANLLELWAQVAVRGELGADSQFVKWDETTWEKKRQELAAIPPPYPDLPFPGYVATDKLHWLRAEYKAAAEKDKLRLATELLNRAESSGDKIEAVRWRAVLAPDQSGGAHAPQ